MHVALRKFLIFIIISFFLTSCNGFFKYSPARENPTKGETRAKKNVEEGRGVSLGGLAKGRGKTNYEFSTSNPMWRASLEILDFLPMTTVDYSGGMIITDWYTDANTTEESLKFTIRFLSNEVRSDSLKIIIHKKTCKSKGENCLVQKISSPKLEQTIRADIIKKAALLVENAKNKKKK